MTNSTLIRNAQILTMDDDLGDIDQGDILVRDGCIAEIGQSLDSGVENEIDASNCIALPGLVNSHIHVWQSAVKGLAGDQTFYYYLENILGRLANAFEPDDIYLANLVGALEQMNGGTTTVLDWCHALSTPDHADRAIDGLEESGIRGIWAYGPPPSTDYWSPETRVQHPEDARRIREHRLHGDEGRIRMALGIRGAIWVPYDMNVIDVDMGRELDVLVTEHAGLPGKAMIYNHEDILRRARDGHLHERMNFVHANDFSPEEFRALADHGCSVSVTAQSEMHLGFGPSGIGLCREAGMAAALGTDVASQCSPDMFSEMRVSLQWQRYIDGVRVLGETGDLPMEVELQTRELLRSATIEGARALGLGDVTGSLTPGKQADLLLVRKDDISTVASQDPCQAIVLYASPATVDTVMVGGHIHKRDGVLQFPGYQDRVAEMGEAGNRIAQAVTQ